MIYIQNFITKQIVKHLNKRGIIVAFWVVNSEKQFQRAIDVIYSLNSVFIDGNQWDYDRQTDGNEEVDGQNNVMMLCLKWEKNLCFY